MADPLREPPAGPEIDQRTPLIEGPPPVSGFWRGRPPPSLPCRLDRYELLRQLGTGGMGAVYLAHDHQLDRRVALKVPHFGGSRPDVLRDRFLREARVAATITHPNICPIHDVGELDGTPYLTMAYVEGEPLSARISRERPWPEREAAELVRVVALAMQEAHRAGVVHRDLKPSNIMINRQGQPVVTDFGLACLVEPGDDRLTDDGTTVGTPAYIPPEQINGDLALMGVGCDVYALGVILYELLTGRVPFAGKRGELMSQVLRNPPPPPSRFRPGLAPGLESICLTALQKHPSDRFRTMESFAAALADFQAGRAVPPPPPFRPFTTSDDTELLSGRSRRRRRLWALGAAVVLLLAGWLIFRGPGKGTVRFELNDPDAEVVLRVDGKPVAHRGPNEPLSLPAGEHIVAATGPWHEAAVERFTLRAGESRLVRLALKLKAWPEASTTAASPGEPKAGPPELEGLKGALARMRNLEEKSQFEEAEQEATRALGLDPRCLEAFLGRARARLKTRQFDAALGDVAEALQVAPGNLEARRVRAEVFFQKKDYAACVEECSAVIRDEKQPGLHVQALLEVRSRGYEALRRYDEAIADCTQALSLVPDARKPVFLRQRAALYEQKGEKTKAQQDRELLRKLEQSTLSPPPPAKD